MHGREEEDDDDGRSICSRLIELPATGNRPLSLTRSLSSVHLHVSVLMPHTEQKVKNNKKMEKEVAVTETETGQTGTGRDVDKGEAGDIKW